jgi:hypothetical protein
MHSPVRRKVIQSLAAFPLSVSSTLKSLSRPKQLDARNRLGSPEVALSTVRFFCTLQATQYANHSSYLSLQEWRDSRKFLKLFGPDRAKRPYASQRVHEFFESANPYSDEIIPGWKLRLLTSKDGQAFTITMHSADKLYASDEEFLIYGSDVFSTAALPKAYVPMSALQTLALSPLGSERASRRSRVASLVQRVAFMSVGMMYFDSCPGSCSGGQTPGCCVWGQLDCRWCCFGSCDGACLYCGAGYMCFCGP